MPVRSLLQYSIKIILDEDSYPACETHDIVLRGNLPHIKRLLNNRFAYFLLREIQNFCWTIARLSHRQKIPAAAARRSLAKQFKPERPPRPLLPTDSALTQCKDRPRFWIDVTNTYRTGVGQGIARVAREMAAAAARTGLALPVIIEDGALYSYYSSPNESGPLTLDKDVTYIVLDAFWHPLEEYIDIFTKAKSAGSRIVTCFHDVIPLYVPLIYNPWYTSLFIKSFIEAVNHSEVCIAVSRYSLKRLAESISAYNLRVTDPPALGWFHLGADFSAPQTAAARDEIRRLFDDRAVFLSVGTIEPRKGYGVTLDAFELIWSKGLECRFVIFGQKGWLSSALQKRILTHPEYGLRLHWFADASDAEVLFAYKNAHCVIQSSITEGFGLPLIEASAAGAPVIAADIEVFREIAADDVIYYTPFDSEDLAKKIETSLFEQPKAASIKYLGWDDSLRQMIAMLEIVRSPAAQLYELRRNQRVSWRHPDRSHFCAASTSPPPARQAPHDI